MARAAMPMMRAAAAKTLKMNPSQPKALSELCMVSALYGYNWKEAERLFVARGRGPISPLAPTRHGFYLQGVGGNDKAIETI